jgi:hypothetical protein
MLNVLLRDKRSHGYLLLGGRVSRRRPGPISLLNYYDQQR